MFLGFSRELNQAAPAVRIKRRTTHQELILRVDFVLVRHQFIQVRRASLPVLRKLAGCKEYAGSAISQDVGIVHLLTLQLRHGHRIHFRRCWLAIAQQFTRVLTFFCSATKVFAEASGLQLHLMAALVTLKHRPVIALDLELTELNSKTVAVRVVTADMQLALGINQVAVHGCVAFLAAPLVQQNSRFFLIVAIGTDNLITRNQINGVLAAFFGWQRVT